MNSFKITAETTDGQIQKATKEDLICALFTGFSARLRDSRRRAWTKARAAAEAVEERNRLAKNS